MKYKNIFFQYQLDNIKIWKANKQNTKRQI